MTDLNIKASLEVSISSACFILAAQCNATTIHISLPDISSPVPDNPIHAAVSHKTSQNAAAVKKKQYLYSISRSAMVVMYTQIHVSLVPKIKVYMNNRKECSQVEVEVLSV